MAKASFRSVTISQKTFDTLQTLLRKLNSREYSALADELDAATIVADELVPPGVVTMNSVVTFRNIDSGRVSTLKLVYPNDPNVTTESVSVLAPVGAALIGLHEGEEICWPLPNGQSAKLKIIDVARP